MFQYFVIWLLDFIWHLSLDICYLFIIYFLNKSLVVLIHNQNSSLCLLFSHVLPK